MIKRIMKTAKSLAVDMMFITAIWMLFNNIILNIFKNKEERVKRMSDLKNANKKIERTVVEGYKKIESGVVDGYKKVEDAFVSGYKNIEDKFVDTFLAEEGETVEEAKKRINASK